MSTYEDLRRDCIEILTSAGELSTLSAEERRTLERGSLAVFGQGRERALRRAQAMLAATLGLSLSAFGIPLGVAQLHLLGLEAPPAVVFPAAALAFGLLGAHVALSRRLARRRELYSDLTESVLAYSPD